MCLIADFHRRAKGGQYAANESCGVLTGLVTANAFPGHDSASQCVNVETPRDTSVKPMCGEFIS